MLSSSLSEDPYEPSRRKVTYFLISREKNQNIELIKAKSIFHSINLKCLMAVTYSKSAGLQ